jgi:hypothetical protein
MHSLHGRRVIALVAIESDVLAGARVDESLSADVKK